MTSYFLRILLHLLVGLEFLADQEVLVPLEDPTMQKNSRALGLHFCTTDLHCQE